MFIRAGNRNGISIWQGVGGGTGLPVSFFLHELSDKMRAGAMQQAEKYVISRIATFYSSFPENAPLPF
jgi:hypothetical protein